MKQEVAIKLTLPAAWIRSLDSISEVRCTSRASLIRLYIEKSMSTDLEEVKRRLHLQAEFERTRKPF